MRARHGKQTCFFFWPNLISEDVLKSVLKSNTLILQELNWAYIKYEDLFE